MFISNLRHARVKTIYSRVYRVRKGLKKLVDNVKWHNLV